MNKRILVLILALAVVIVGSVAAYALTRPATEPVASSTTLSSPTAPAPTANQSGAPATAAGVYVDYSSTAIADAKGRTFLFFHAPWCPKCRSMESDILSSGVPAGITVIKVDYDSHQDLRQKYGVTIQTTFVEVDSSGAGLKTYIAYDDPRLKTVLAAML